MEILNNVLNYISDNGLLGFIYLCMALIAILFFRGAWYMLPYWTKDFTAKSEQKKLKARTTADKCTREKISQLLINTKADRAMVMEFHNGKENMTGLPFRYGTFTYEMAVETMPRISQKYDELNLSRYTAPLYLMENKFFIGTTDKFKQEVDREMGNSLKEDKIDFLGLMLLRQNNITIGILMLTYSYVPTEIPEQKILGNLTQYAQEISSLLTLDKKSWQK